jgi:hypothetical protein
MKPQEVQEAGCTCTPVLPDAAVVADCGTAEVIVSGRGPALPSSKRATDRQLEQIVNVLLIVFGAALIAFRFGL